MRLEIGSGGFPDPRYDIHMDIRENQPHVEVVGDAKDLFMFDDSSFEVIKAHDVLEHFSHRDIPSVLAEWLRVLEPGGVIHLCVPNFKPMAERYLSINEEYVVPNDALAWSYWMFGGQDYEGEEWRYNAHYVIFDVASWERLAEDVGFTIIKCDDDGGTNLLVDIGR